MAVNPADNHRLAFLVDHRIGFKIKLSPFRMANNDVSRADVPQHCSRYLAGVGTLFNLSRTVLSGNANIGSFEPIGDSF